MSFGGRWPSARRCDTGVLASRAAGPGLEDLITHRATAGLRFTTEATAVRDGRVSVASAPSATGGSRATMLDTGANSEPPVYLVTDVGSPASLRAATGSVVGDGTSSEGDIRSAPVGIEIEADVGG